MKHLWIVWAVGFALTWWQISRLSGEVRELRGLLALSGKSVESERQPAPPSASATDPVTQPTAQQPPLFNLPPAELGEPPGVPAEAASPAVAIDSAAVKAEVRAYSRRIQSKVAANWVRPATGVAANTSCVIEVATQPNGEILAVRIVRGSGNPVFDQSAQQAVARAAPLPLPTNAEIYTAHFQKFSFTFKPGI